MAKWYYAKMHVAVGGYIARPGEVIEGDFSKEDIAHWLKIGAIAECGEPEGVSFDEPNQPEDVAAHEETDAESETANEEGAGEEMPAITADIDVMAGITAPKAKTTRKRKA